MPTLKIPAEIKPLHFLKQWREHKGYSLTDFAARCGTTKGVVSRWETGDRNMSLEVQFLVARRLGIWVGQLFQPPGDQMELVRDFIAKSQSAERDALMDVARMEETEGAPLGGGGEKKEADPQFSI